MNSSDTATPGNLEGKPLAVSVRTMCRLLDIGNTKAWELIGLGRVQTFTIGRKRLVVFSSIEQLIPSAGEPTPIAETRCSGRPRRDARAPIGEGRSS
jgi:hypothetical protein